MLDRFKKSYSLLDYSFFLFMASVPIEAIKDYFWSFPLSLSTPFGVLFVVLYVATHASNKSFRVPWQLLLPIPFLLVIMYHYVFSHDLEYFYEIVTYLNNIAFAVVLFNYLRHRGNAREGLLVMGASTVVCGFLILATQGTAILQGGRYTLGTFGENGLAYSLAFGVLIIASAYITGKFSLLMTCLYGIPTLSTLAVIVATGSRGVMLALSITFLFLVIINITRILSNPRTLAFVMAVVVFSTYFLLLDPVAIERWQYTLAGTETSAFANRDVIFAETVKMIDEKPVLGWGLRETYFELGARVDGGGFRGTHNTFLMIIATTGIVGGIFLVVFFLYPVVRFKDFWRNRDYQQLFVLFIYLMIVFMSLEMLNRKQIWIVYSMMLAIIYQSRFIRSQLTLPGWQNASSEEKE